MENLKIFSNEEFGSIRTTTINEEVYFVGKDIVNILQYQNGSRDINRHVDEEDREKVMIFDGSQNKETIVINESGLYSLILRSKLPSAKKFKRWVTSEVLPSIRKHGAYATEIILEKMLGDPDFAIGLFTNLKQEQEKRKEAELIAEQRRREIAYKQKVIEKQKPKVKFYECAIDKESTYTTTEVAKSLGFRTAHRLSLFLKEKGVVYRQGKRWILTAKYAEQGYQKIRAYTNCEHGTLVWTLKGYEFIKKLYEEENGEIC